MLRHHPDAIEIDSFIMSCRAMGFGLEQYLLADVLAATAGETVDAPFIPTDRNGPAASLYPSCGFTETSPGQWRLRPDDPRPQAPGWFAPSQPRRRLIQRPVSRSTPPALAPPVDVRRIRRPTPV